MQSYAIIDWSLITNLPRWPSGAFQNHTFNITRELHLYDYVHLDCHTLEAALLYKSNAYSIYTQNNMIAS